MQMYGYFPYNQNFGEKIYRGECTNKNLIYLAQTLTEIQTLSGLFKSAIACS